MKKQTILSLIIVLSCLCCFQCKQVEGPTGPPGSEGLTDPSIQPKVIWTLPANGSEGPYTYDPYTYRIIVRFNKIMNVQTVLKAARLTSPTTNVRIDTIYSFTLDGITFWFYPTDTTSYYYGYRWKVGEQYTLSIDQSAKDINGNSLTQSNIVFKPEPYFRVVQVSPPNGANNVPISTSIYIYFNSPVRSTIVQSILSNLSGGSWQIDSYDSSSISYYPSYPGLSYNTTYNIVINTTARDKYGNQLPRQFTSSFTTQAAPPLQVTNIYPYNGQTNVSRYTSIEVDFNTSIDTSTVRAAFSISPAVTGYFYYYYYPINYFIFSPQAQLAANQLYSVTIDTTLRSLDGRRLASPYTFSFTTGN